VQPTLTALAAVLSLSALPSQAATVPAAQLQELAERTQVPEEALQQAVGQASFNQTVLDAIQRPWEARPWHEYYPIFLTSERIDAGVAFWREHRQTLEQAETTYQVPAQMIVAIIGVETFYGRHKGTYPVLDALYTLGFHYPPRSDFFSAELARFVQLSRQEGLSLTDTHGSYAGAMGWGQFIPSSYLAYAVDFDGDGRRDLLNNPVDAIGSVANYFHRHGWRAGEPVALRATATPAQAAPWLSPDLEWQPPWSQLAADGIHTGRPLDADVPVKLFAFSQPEQDEYWLGLHNFYVITRYNRSPLYAMAVYQLAQAIKAADEVHAGDVHHEEQGHRG